MLPKVNDQYYTYNINNKEIQYRLWKTKDEKNFLIMNETNGENEITFDDIFKTMVKPVIKYDGELTDSEKNMILLEIRKKSIGSNIDLNFKCSCGKSSDIQVDINDMVNYTPSSFQDITKNNITVKLLETPEKDDNKYDIYENSFMEFINSIKNITIDGVMYEDFTRKELAEFMDNLDTITFDYMFNKFVNMSESLEYHAEAKCMFCGSVEDLEIDSIPNFFPW